MPIKRPSDFVAADRIEQMTSPMALRIALGRAERRVIEAETIGWPALADSWRGSMRRIAARMAELQIGPAQTRYRRERGMAAARKAVVAEEVCA